MHFEVGRCADEDMERAFTVLSEAFGHRHPLIEHTFPHHDTPEGRRIGGQRLRDAKNSDPMVNFIKVTDTDTGVIVGMAKWILFDGKVPEEVVLDGQYWDNERDKKIAQAISKGFVIPRSRAVQESNGNLISLDIMCVHPDYQRKGAGSMLLRWGTDIADQKKIKAVVEASVKGRPLYATEGFLVEIENCAAELPPEFADLDTEYFTWMSRPAKP